jgi:ankyrin repeat protein
VADPNFDLIKVLLDQGADINVTDTRGRTVLFELVSRECFSIESIQFLLDHGADINAKDHLGRTSLHILVAGWPSPPQRRIIRFLINRGINVNATNDRGESALQLMFQSNFRLNIELVELLLEAGAKIDLPDSIRGQTALHQAASQRHVDGALCLIQHGANVDAQDVRGNTALHVVTENAYCCCGHVPFDCSLDILRCLLSHGAKQSIRNAQGKTPLELACESSACVDRLYTNMAMEQRQALGIPLSSLDFSLLLIEAFVQETREWVSVLHDGPNWMT